MSVIPEQTHAGLTPSHTVTSLDSSCHDQFKREAQREATSQGRLGRVAGCRFRPKAPLGVQGRLPGTSRAERDRTAEETLCAQG